MVQNTITQKQAKEVATDFVKYIQKEARFKIDRAYLFGSFAKNKQHEFSDIDVCIVSKDFRRVDPISFMARKRRDIDIDYGIEAIGIAKEDFVKFNPIAYEVKKYGIPLEID